MLGRESQEWHFVCLVGVVLDRWLWVAYVATRDHVPAWALHQEQVHLTVKCIGMYRLLCIVKDELMCWCWRCERHARRNVGKFRYFAGLR